jgi:UPF0716 protein FxsA
MLPKLLFVFILVPLMELFILLKLADATSVWTTLAIVIGTGIAGSMLARREGIAVWRRFRQSIAEGQIPNREIQNGLLIVFAAALLLTPGLITDTLGLILLIPTTREWVRKYLANRYQGRFSLEVDSRFHQTRFDRGDTIDAESFESRRHA